jgi:hypothetical protein
MNVRADSNAVVFDTISSAEDVKLRNAVVKNSDGASTSFTVRVQGSISAVVNQASLDSFKDSERSNNNARQTLVQTPPKRPRASSYASMFLSTPEPDPRPIKFTKLHTKPMFLNPVMQFFVPKRPLRNACQPQSVTQPLAVIDKPQEVDARPPSPIFRTRFSSTEIIIAGVCMFPVNDMLDMGGLRSRSHSREEVVAISALAEMTGE